MWLPEKIYDALPFLYSALALLVLYFFPSSRPAELSAAALFLAAAMVVYWRFSARIQIRAMIRSFTRTDVSPRLYR